MVCIPTKLYGCVCVCKGGKRGDTRGAIDGSTETASKLEINFRPLAGESGVLHKHLIPKSHLYTHTHHVAVLTPENIMPLIMDLLTSLNMY